MQQLRLFVILIFAISASVEQVYASDKVTSEDEIRYSPKIETIFPIFLGAGVGVTFHRQFELKLLYGLTPRPYYEVIGSAAAKLGNNPAYADVIESAFQDNSLWRVGAKYHFEDLERGWHIGFAYMRLSSQGEADIDTVLTAATGLNYTILKTALTARGRSMIVDIKSSLNIGEIHGGYTWPLGSNLTLTTELGLAKIISSEIKLDTGLDDFEETIAGSELIDASESGLESIVNKYGITPTVAIAVSYLF